MPRLKLCLLVTLLFSSLCAARAQNPEYAEKQAREQQLLQELSQARTLAEGNALLTARKESFSFRFFASLIKTGDQSLIEKKYDRSLNYFQWAIFVAEQLNSPNSQAAAISRMGDACYYQGSYECAQQHYQTALSRFDELKMEREAAKTVFNLGLTAKAKKNSPEAMRYFEQTLERIEKIKLPFASRDIEELTAEASGYIAAIHLERQEYAAALAAFSKAPASDPVSNKLFLLANDFYRTDDYDFAASFYQQAANGFARLNNRNGLVSALYGLGNAQYGAFEFEAALETYHATLKLAEESNNAAMRAETLGTLGSTTYALGLNAQALEFYQKGLQQYESNLNKGGAGRMLRGLGNVYFRLGQYEPALEAFQKCLPIFEAAAAKEDAATIILRIGLVYAAQAKYDEALRQYDEAHTRFETLREFSKVADCLFRSSLVYVSRNELVQALSYSDQAMTVAVKAEDFSLQWRIRLLAGRIHLRLEQYEDAQKAFEQSISLIEKSRALFPDEEADAAGDRVAPYAELAALLVLLDKNKDALEYTERGRAQLLWDLQHSTGVYVSKGMLPADVEKELKLRRDLNKLSRVVNRANEESNRLKLKTELQKKRSEYTLFLNRLYQRNPPLKTFRAESASLKAEPPASLLTDNRTALLQYLVTDDRAFLFVLTKPATRKQPRATLNVNAWSLGIRARDLLERVSNFQRAIASREDTWQSAARELYDLLIKPAEAELASKTSLTILPDGSLWALPFAALQSAENRFLIDNYAISLAPSLMMQREMTKPGRLPRSNSKAASSLLAVVNPATSPATMTPELSAEFDREVKTIESVYNNSSTRVLTAAEASKEKLRAEITQHNIVHLAVPFAISNSRPLTSFIPLAPNQTGNANDVRLRLRELMSLEAKNGLMIFSATTLFPDALQSFNGMTSLTWSTMIAGAPTIIASQWQATSPASTELLTELHQHLKNNATKSSTAAALQQSMLKLKKSSEYQHPFFWAGFVLCGNSR